MSLCNSWGKLRVEVLFKLKKMLVESFNHIRFPLANPGNPAMSPHATWEAGTCHTQTRNPITCTNHNWHISACAPIVTCNSMQFHLRTFAPSFPTYRFFQSLPHRKVHVMVYFCQKGKKMGGHRACFRDHEVHF